MNQAEVDQMSNIAEQDLPEGIKVVSIVKKGIAKIRSQC